MIINLPSANLALSAAIKPLSLILTGIVYVNTLGIWPQDLPGFFLPLPLKLPIQAHPDFFYGLGFQPEPETSYGFKVLWYVFLLNIN